MLNTLLFCARLNIGWEPVIGSPIIEEKIILLEEGFQGVNVIPSYRGAWFAVGFSQSI